MELEISPSSDAVIVSLSGEVTSRDDQKAASDMIDRQLAEGTRRFVFDLSEVPYVSSLGIAVLVAACVKIGNGGGSLGLVNPRPKVVQILEMTKVSHLFSTYDNVEDALGAV